MKAYLACLLALCLIAIFTMYGQQSQLRKAEFMAERNECFKCHRANDGKKAIGPSFQQIAEKFRKDSLSNDSMSMRVLVDRVKNGSKGHWTELSRGVPMPPYKGRLTEAEIREIVAWALQQKN